MKRRELVFAIVALLLAALAVGTMGCDEGGGDGSDGDGDTDSDVDTDTETETECADVEYAGQLFVNGIPSDWQMNGYVDADDSGTLEGDELTAMSFTLDEIHCSGKQSLIWFVGDYS